MTNRQKTELAVLIIITAIVLVFMIAYPLFCMNYLQNQVYLSDSNVSDINTIDGVVYNDVEFNSIYMGYNDDVYLNFFNGLTGDPTIGSLFFSSSENNEYAPLYSNYSWSTAWTDHNTFLDFAPTMLLPGLGESKYYLFTFSFDFYRLNSSSEVYSTRTVGGTLYNVFSYMNFYNYGTDIMYLDFMYPSSDKDILNYNYSNIYMYDRLSGNIIKLNVSNYSGEFIQLSIAIPEYYYNSNAQLTTRMSCSINYQCSVRPNSNVVELDNQIFLNNYSYNSVLSTLYTFESSASFYDEYYQEYIQQIRLEEYNKGYSIGLSDGQSVANSDWLSGLFSSVSSIFNIYLFNGITVGFLVFIPLVFGIILFIFKLVRG